MKPKILVLGALGNVGSEVVKSLLAQGVPVRAADIYPNKITERFRDEVEPVLFDFSRPETFSSTFSGIRRLFLIRPPQISNIQKDMVPALDAAKAAGVHHIVFLSIIGIEQNTVVPHYKVEQWLVNSGLDYTFLRSNFFMQNLNTTHRDEIRKKDEIFVPVKNARTSFLDVRDIGAVAAVVLTEPGHERKAYDLTGGEALDYYQVADIFSEVLERKIEYKNPSTLSFFFRQLRGKSNLAFALVTTWLYSNTRNGMANVVTNDVEHLLGRKPISMRQYVLDNKESWMMNSAI
jgi:uncharacterized protein YbjT (DUF2867 family)